VKTAIANNARTCPAWCATHIDETEVCLGTNVTIDVTAAAGWQSWMAKALSVMLGAAPDEGVSISLAINHTGPYDVPVSVARQYALAILAQCERVEAPLIPGPRTSSEGGVK
jgi:hypothetical protein